MSKLVESFESFELERDLERAPGRDLVRRARERLRHALAAGEGVAVGLMERHALTALRVALAVVFLWFGALKVLGRSPVEDIVTATVFFLPGKPVILVLGGLELAIGLGLLVPVAPRLTLLLFLGQMSGTFLTLVVLRDRAFQGGNPLLLDVLGEFVVKNLVLVAAGLAIGPSIWRRSARRGGGRLGGLAPPARAPGA